ncbi:MAG: hypothetical protein ABR570_10565 [Burkholderiales bacterium]
MRHAALARHSCEGREFEARRLRSYFEYRDLDIKRASEVRLRNAVVYVLKGWLLFEFQPRRSRHRELKDSRNLEMIEVVVPATCKAYSVRRT